MTHGSLFSGIGGFDLAAEWMGWENIFHCEIAEFPRKILKYHFPKSICYEDIKKTDFTKHRGEIDIISGGFPCQPYSNAGQRKGKEDDRHLWPQMLRVIREIQPRFVVGENVAGLLSWNNGMVFHEIITDLENEGYETQAFLIPACATNAPHRRDRVWFVANSRYNAERKTRNSSANEGKQSSIIHTNKQRRNKSSVFNNRLCNLQRDIAQSNNGSRSCDTVQTGRTELKKLHESQSNATNANVHGFEQCNGNNEINASKGRFNALGDVIPCFSDGNATNTESKGSRQQSPKNTGWQDRRFDNNVKIWDVADTECTNSKTRKYGKVLGQQNRKKTNRHSNVERKNQWQNFPTQSPICGGDDGIPDKLDGITFSRWRNESIKGYGNAVVPQVVYQIFKAIEQSIK